MPVGDDKTAIAAASLYQLINRTGQPVVVSDPINQQPGFDLQEVLKLSYLLSSYELITKYSWTRLGQVGDFDHYHDTPTAKCFAHPC